MAARNKAEGKTITLIQWLIEKIDTKGYRAGNASGYHHPRVDGTLMQAIGGRESFLTQAREIERDPVLGGIGRIWFDWCDVNTNIRTVHYSTDIMPRLCEREGIEDPRDRQLRYIDILEGWMKRADGTWLDQYYEEELRLLREGNCAQTTTERIEDGYLYRCLDEIIHLEEPIEKRIFSARVFRNVKMAERKFTPSKIFEKKYESAVIGIMMKYSSEYEAGMSNDEILAAHGIRSYSQTLEWKGPLVYALDSASSTGIQNPVAVDTSVNVYGTILNTRTLEHASPSILPGVTKVLVIENKANYEKLQYRSDTLYIFCHGFFSPKEVRFLSKIAAIAEKDVQYYHWGDMDYGGIRIYQFNKAKVFPKLKPYKMGKEEYEKAILEGAGVPVEDKKRKKIELLEAGVLTELKECILKYGLEIEQELLIK